eukprot:3094105-Prymnesium_polylepis.1
MNIVPRRRPAREAATEGLQCTPSVPASRFQRTKGVSSGWRRPSTRLRCVIVDVPVARAG